MTPPIIPSHLPFMDNQDGNEWGGPTCVSSTYDDHAIGALLLRHWGWRQSSDSNIAYIPMEEACEVQELYNRKITLPTASLPQCKSNVYGIGCVPFQNAPEFQEEHDRQQNVDDTRSILRSVGGFALQDDEEDVYDGSLLCNKVENLEKDYATVAYESEEDCTDPKEDSLNPFVHAVEDLSKLDGGTRRKTISEGLSSLPSFVMGGMDGTMERICKRWDGPEVSHNTVVARHVCHDEPLNERIQYPGDADVDGTFCCHDTKDEKMEGRSLPLSIPKEEQMINDTIDNTSMTHVMSTMGNEDASTTNEIDTHRIRYVPSTRRGSKHRSVIRNSTKNKNWQRTRK